MLNERFLGGEVGHRSIFGRTTNRTRRAGLLVIFAVSVVVSLWVAQKAGPALGLVAAALWWAATAKTSMGSPYERWRARRAWRQRTRSGYDTFVPVSQRPAGLDRVMLEGSRRERDAVRREWSAYRDWPEGAQGMQWLFSGPGLPGIAWHTPTGEDAWLSVVFPVQGQIHGLQGDDVVNSRSEAFGRMLTAISGSTSLLRRVQMVTRVQSVDTARHEAWVLEHLDERAPRELLQSYADVMDMIGRGGLMQRHYAVGRWPLTPLFTSRAAKKGPDQVGWIRLMAEEIERMWRLLSAAGLQPGRALSAAQVAAMLRHQQLPSWPLDQAGDVDPLDLWVPQVEGWSYVEARGVDPLGDEDRWFHRTARVAVDRMDTTQRDPLWMMPFLTQMSERVVRTVSVQMEGIPTSEARKRARDDLTSDLADADAQSRRGALIDDDLAAGVDAARARARDLKPGQGFSGVGWAMHITVSAQSLDELSAHSTLMTEQAEHAGLGLLDWMDPWQAAAQACTWPLARGMRPTTAGALGGLLSQGLMGTGAKEAL